MEKIDFPIIARYGLIGAAIMIVIGLLSYMFFETLFGNMWMSMGIGIAMLGMIIFIGVWGGIAYRSAHGNVISFANAFIAVYCIFLIIGLSGAVSNMLINKVIDPDYPKRAAAFLKDKYTEQFEKMNMTEEQIQKATKDFDESKFDPPIAELLKRSVINALLLAILAVVIAAFIKRNSDDLVNLNAPPA